MSDMYQMLAKLLTFLPSDSTNNWNQTLQLLSTDLESSLTSTHLLYCSCRRKHFNHRVMCIVISAHPAYSLATLHVMWELTEHYSQPDLHTTSWQGCQNWSKLYQIKIWNEIKIFEFKIYIMSVLWLCEYTFVPQHRFISFHVSQLDAKSSLTTLLADLVWRGYVIRQI